MLGSIAIMKGHLEKIEMAPDLLARPKGLEPLTF